VEQRRHSVCSADPVTPTDCDHGFAAFGDGLIRHERLALIMALRLRRWGRVGRRFRLVGRRLWRRLRRGVILRRRRDNDQRRRKILAGGGKRRADGDQRKRSSKSNGVRLHRRVSCLRFARRAARPTDAPARGGNPIWSRLTNSPIRVARCTSTRRLALQLGLDDFRRRRGAIPGRSLPYSA
jgi:hypothetical protein